MYIPKPCVCVGFIQVQGLEDIYIYIYIHTHTHTHFPAKVRDMLIHECFHLLCIYGYYSIYAHTLLEVHLYIRFMCMLMSCISYMTHTHVQGLGFIGFRDAHVMYIIHDAHTCLHTYDCVCRDASQRWLHAYFNVDQYFENSSVEYSSE